MPRPIFTRIEPKPISNATFLDSYPQTHLISPIIKTRKKKPNYQNKSFFCLIFGIFCFLIKNKEAKREEVTWHTLSKNGHFCPPPRAFPDLTYFCSNRGWPISHAICLDPYPQSQLISQILNTVYSNLWFTKT